LRLHFSLAINNIQRVGCLAQEQSLPKRHGNEQFHAVSITFNWCRSNVFHGSTEPYSKPAGCVLEQAGKYSLRSQSCSSKWPDGEMGQKLKGS
jgi:hypothetical protein